MKQAMIDKGMLQFPKDFKDESAQKNENETREAKREAYVDFVNAWRDERKSDNYRSRHPYESPSECIRDCYVNEFDY